MEECFLQYVLDHHPDVHCELMNERAMIDKVLLLTTIFVFLISHY